MRSISATAPHGGGDHRTRKLRFSRQRAQTAKRSDAGRGTLLGRTHHSRLSPPRDRTCGYRPLVSSGNGSVVCPRGGSTNDGRTGAPVSDPHTPPDGRQSAPRGGITRPAPPPDLPLSEKISAHPTWR